MTTQAPQVALNPRMIVPFVNAVRDVFLKMANVQVTVSSPRFKSHAEPTYGVCGIIGFSGGVTGSVVLSFSDSAAEKLVEAFAGVAIKKDSPDFADAVGELANMVAGAAKPHLGGVASISTPSVIIGKGYTVSSPSGLPCLVIPCGSPFGDFCVEVSIKGKP
jgi:chemotaxis protein CheX